MIDKSLWLLAILIWLMCDSVQSDEDEGEYGCGFTDIAVTCPNYENKNVALQLSLSSDSEHATLSGKINMDKELDDKCEVSIDVWKKGDDGSEDPVFSVSGGLCASMKDTDAPWFPIYENMGITSCPVAIGEYEISELKLKLDFADSVMNADFVAKYRTQLKITCGVDDFCCFCTGIEIYQKDE